MFFALLTTLTTLTTITTLEAPITFADISNGAASIMQSGYQSALDIDIAFAVVFLPPALIIAVFSVLAVSAKNPMHGILYLAMCFFSFAGIGFIMFAEFISVLFIAVYIGAVIILCMFVIMMIDDNGASQVSNTSQNGSASQGDDASSFSISVTQSQATWFIFGCTCLLVVFTIMVFLSSIGVNQAQTMALGDTEIAGFTLESLADFNLLQKLGENMYSVYHMPLLFTGVLLYVGVVGAVLLTKEYILPRREGLNMDKQSKTEKSDLLTMHKVKSGSGIKF